MGELWQQSAAELAQTFRSGAASAAEIVTAHLTRIDAVNPTVNAVVRRLDESALATALDVDRAKAGGDELGPLAGVPFTIKDNIDLAGDVTTHSVAAYADFVPTLDAPVVERMKEAGAIPLARTNLPDLGLRLDSDSSLHGWTANPWNLDRTAGGSSGGEAAALATGMTPLGLGNDIGGSLRNPASCCGIASLKPTFGLVPHALQGPLGEESLTEQIIAVEGPMARTVSDVRLQLKVLAGVHPRDPWSVPATLEGSTMRPFRIALIAEPPGGSTDPRIADITTAAAERLRSKGHLVTTTTPPEWQETLDCWTSIVVGGIAAGMDEMRELLGPDSAAFLDDSIAADEALTDPEQHEAAWTNRHLLIQAWNRFFVDYDAVLTPTWTELPFQRGSDIAPGGAAKTIVMARAIKPANVLGFPSAAVPGGLVDGLPVGLLVTGPAWSDLLCLAIAEAIEADAPATPIDPRGPTHA